MNRLLVGGLIVLGAGAATLMWYQSATDITSKSTETVTEVTAEVSSVTGGETAIETAMETSMDDPAFFETPKSAVQAIKVMLRQEEWASLARYYDLSGSDVDRASLVSGDFFIRAERPEVAHPAGFWRYKHPFPPSFDYRSASPADAVGIVTIQVAITIDQGVGSPAQQGFQEFRMKQSSNGYQVLPD